VILKNRVYAIGCEMQKVRQLKNADEMTTLFNSLPESQITDANSIC